mmetsp:Transcript_283/g.356  ORF Transcript_283/g.356 Transcript_283/m.356 type:complete len:306 (+) Transcript_283:485-1402(+)
MADCFRVISHESQCLKEFPSLEEGGEGEEHGAGVHAGHHLELVHAVFLVHLALPLGGEGVAAQVEGQQHDAQGGALRRTLAGVLLLGESEEADADCDDQCFQVLSDRIALPVHELAHEHHGDDLAGLGHHLHGEGDVLQALVLGPAAQHVGERAGRVPHQRCLLLEPGAVAQLGVVHEGQGHPDRDRPVAEHQERGGGEHVPRGVRAGHHLLLQHAPRDVRHLQPHKAQRQLDGPRLEALLRAARGGGGDRRRGRRRPFVRSFIQEGTRFSLILSILLNVKRLHLGIFGLIAAPVNRDASTVSCL